MAALLVLSEIALPIVSLFIIIAIVALVAANRYDMLCEYAFITSAIIIIVVVIFNVIVGLIVGIMDLCALI